MSGAHDRELDARRRNDGPVTAPIFTRCVYDIFSERAAEGPEAAEAYVRADLRHCAATVTQQNHRTLDAPPLQVAIRAVPESGTAAGCSEDALPYAQREQDPRRASDTRGLAMGFALEDRVVESDRWFRVVAASKRQSRPPTRLQIRGHRTTPAPSGGCSGSTEQATDDSAQRATRAPVRCPHLSFLRSHSSGLTNSIESKTARASSVSAGSTDPVPRTAITARSPFKSTTR